MSNTLFKTATANTTTNTAPSYLITFDITDANTNDTAELTCFITTSSNTKGIKLNLPNNRKAFFDINDTDKIQTVLNTLITPTKNKMFSTIKSIETMNKARIVDVLTGEYIEDINDNKKSTYSKIDIEYTFDGKAVNNNVIKMYFNHGKNKVISLPNDVAIENTETNQSLINGRICGIITNSILDNYNLSISSIELYNPDTAEDDFDIEDL